MSDKPLWGKTTSGESWHIALDEEDPEILRLTLCGRTIMSPLLPDFKASEKTCESCLRIYASDDVD